MRKELGFMIKMISDNLKKQFDTNFTSSGVTFQQFNVIRLILINRGPLSFKAVREELGISHPTLSGIISRMESAGLVTTYCDEDDARVKMVDVTDKTLAFRDQLNEDRDRAESIIQSGFTDEELQQLFSLLERLYENTKKF